MTGRESLIQFARSPRQWLENRRADRRAVATWERLKARPIVERDPLWKEFGEACLQADGERLADIGDLVQQGVSVELFRLTPNERIIVDAYLGGSVAE